MLQADEMIDDDEMIDRVLDSNLRIIRHFQTIPMEQGTTTFFHGPMLTWVQNIHDGGCPHTRRIVQRALFRAGHTNLHAFATGHVIAWLTTSIPDQGEGRGEIIYLTPRMEETLWRNVAARGPDARWSFVAENTLAAPTSALIIRSISNIPISEADIVIARAPDAPDEPDEPDEPRTEAQH